MSLGALARRLEVTNIQSCVVSNQETHVCSQFCWQNSQQVNFEDMLGMPTDSHTVQPTIARTTVANDPNPTSDTPGLPVFSAYLRLLQFDRM